MAKYSLDDIGSRYRHYYELIEYFEFGLDALKSMVKSVANQQKEAELKATVILLKIHMEVLANYEDNKWEVWHQVNSLPSTADCIKGGRGTPLNTTEEQNDVRSND